MGATVLDIGVERSGARVAMTPFLPKRMTAKANEIPEGLAGECSPLNTSR